MSMNPYMILVSITLLAVLLLWWEYRRINTARRWWRCLAILIAAGSLAALAYPLNQSTGNSSTGILLTVGYNKDSLAALQKQFPVAPAYTPEQLLVSDDTSITNWHILGYGLDKTQLVSLNAQQRIFHPSPIHTGISYSSWSHLLDENQPLIVQGSYTNKNDDRLQLVLEGYGVVQDSMSIPARTTGNFSLRSSIKHMGQAVFRLQLKQGKKLIEDNAVPFTTIGSKKIRLLVLSSAPDFEYRFLQNWLGKSGYPSAIRTVTSRDKFEQAFINRSAVSLRNISASLLDSFDIVLADLAAMEALSEQERGAIRQQVANKGMGLLLRADTIGAARFYTRGVVLRSIKANAQQTIQPRLIKESTALGNLPAPDPIIIQKNSQLNDWVTDIAGNTLVAASLQGMGKMAITTIDNSFQWMLSGNENVYSAYWTSLLRSAARQENNAAALIGTTAIYTKGQPLPVELVYADTVLPLVTVNNTTQLALQQQTSPFLWQGTFWSMKEGWQEINVGGITQFIYVYGIHDWPMVKASERLSATAAWAQQDRRPDTNQSTGMIWEKWWFLALFLLALGYLWVERKYFT